ADLEQSMRIKSSRRDGFYTEQGWNSPLSQTGKALRHDIGYFDHPSPFSSLKAHTLDQLGMGRQDVRDNFLKAQTDHEVSDSIRHLFQSGEPPDGEGSRHNRTKLPIASADCNILRHIDRMHEIITI